MYVVHTEAKRSENRIAIKRLSLAHRKQVTFTKALVKLRISRKLLSTIQKID